MNYAQKIGLIGSCALVLALLITLPAQAATGHGPALTNDTNLSDVGLSAYLGVPEHAEMLSISADTSLTMRTVGIQGGRFGVGFSSSWPAYGLSGAMLINERTTAEAVLGFFGTLSTYSGRLWYRFDRNETHDFYGFGAVNMYQYRYGSTRTFRGTETVVGISGGIGVESGLQKLFNDEDFLPLYVNAELGLALASFDHYSFSSLAFGFGVRYRFGAR